MKKLRALLETLLAEIEGEDTGPLEPRGTPLHSPGVATASQEQTEIVREKLKPIVHDLQSHQARLEAEDQLRAKEMARMAKLSRFQEAEIKALIESLPDAVMIGTHDGLSICNASALRILGIPSLDLIRSHGRQIPCFDLRWPDGRAMTERELPFARALRGDSLVEEYLGTRPDTGEPVHLRAAAAPILDGEEIAGALVILSDITERRLEAEKLRLAYEQADRLYAQLDRQTAELNAVLDALPDGLYLGDMDGVRRCNRQGLRLLGVTSAEELRVDIGQLVERFNIRDLESGRLLKPEETTFGRALKGETVALNLLHTDLSTGQERIMRSSAAPVLLDGRVIAAVAVNTDITDQIRGQLASEAQNSQLDQMVSERTRELTRANVALEGALGEVERLKERLEAENAYLQVENNCQYNFGEVVGKSEALKEVFFRIETVAPKDTTVLLLGETGTGKGMMARAIHARSARRDRPMVMVNCTALPANLIESELFGREKGAFTGANAQQIGRFELADKGTIFLDEVGDLPLELQSKLLHVLQEREFSRLGSPHTIKVNVRIIAATNRDLKEEMAKGRFREDLYYRLNIFPLVVPPLRQRKEDLPLLVDCFLRRFCREMGKDIKHVSAATMRRLMEHSWPGNVRELENVLERAVITTQGDTLQVLDHFDPPPAADSEGEAMGCLTLAELERAHILKVLKLTNGRIDGPNGAAALLGLNPSTLRGRMRKGGIQRWEWAVGSG